MLIQGETFMHSPYLLRNQSSFLCPVTVSVVRSSPQLIFRAGPVWQFKFTKKDILAIEYTGSTLSAPNIDHFCRRRHIAQTSVTCRRKPIVPLGVVRRNPVGVITDATSIFCTHINQQGAERQSGAANVELTLSPLWVWFQD